MQISQERYTTVAIWLHWIIAIMIVANLIIGLDFSDPLPGQRFAPKPLLWLHVSLGITVLLLSFVRLAWRLRYRPPPHPAAMPAWEKRSAAITHALFYVLMISMPLSGWLVVSAHKVYPFKTMIWEVIPWPMISVFGHMTTEQVEIWHSRFVTLHSVSSLYLLIAMLLLHLGAVAKHHILDRDPVLRRMWPFAGAPNGSSPNGGSLNKD